MAHATKSVNPYISPEDQLELPLTSVPSAIRRHGLRAAHPRPLVSNGKVEGEAFRSWRTSPSRAWRWPEVQYGDAGSSIAAIVLDCDDPERLGEARAEMPPANFVIVRTANDHAHVVYTLAKPVHKHPKARIEPLRLLGHVSEYLVDQYGADPGYNGILGHNPAPRMKQAGYRTDWGREQPYSLDDLASVIPFNWEPPVVRQSAIGRNVEIFESLMSWAGRKANAKTAVSTAAAILNQRFEHPLPDSEIRATCKQVEKYRAQWAAKGWHRPQWVEKQRARGVLSGKARRSRVAGRDAAIVQDRIDGMTQAAIGKKHGISQRAVHRILKRDFELYLNQHR